MSWQIIHCKDNLIMATALAERLGKVVPGGINTLCETSESDNGLYDRVDLESGPVLLLLTDNFLRNRACMHQLLHAYQHWHSLQKVMVVLADGYQVNPQTGIAEAVPTRIDRVGNFIQYMNHWQDAYLHIRQEYAQDLDHPVVKITRNISTEVGEFIRLLREHQYFVLENLEAQHFDPLFQLTGNPALTASYQNLFAQELPIHKMLVDFAPASTANETSNSPNTQPIMAELETATLPAATLIAIDDAEGLLRQNLPVNQDEDDDDLEDEDDDELEDDDDFEDDDFDDEEFDVDDEDFEEDDDEDFDDDDFEDDDDDDDFDEDEDVEDKAAALVFTGAATPSSQNLSGRLEEARALFTKGKVKEGLALYQFLVTTHPEDLNVRQQFVLALLDQKRFQEAKDQLEAITEIDRNNIKAWLQLAELAEQEGDYLLARSYYEKVIYLDPYAAPVYYRLGLITASFFPEQLPAALDYLKKAAKLDKTSVDARYRLGVLLYEQAREYPKAIKQLKKVLGQKPDHPFANYDLALVYHKLSDFKTAAEYYQAAWSINPELRTPENDLAFQYQSDEAVEAAIPAVADTQIPVFFDKAEVYEATGASPLPPQDAPVQTPVATVLVTGATSGIGRATAAVFARNGYQVILTGRRVDRLAALQDQFRKDFKNPFVFAFGFDVRRLAAVKDAFAQIQLQFPQIDLLINNAGLAKGLSYIHEGDVDHWEQMIDTNIKGLLYMTRAVAPGMVARRKGHIINICSTAGHDVYPKGNVYCATKFAVDALTKGMRMDLYQHGIRVSQVSPGHTEETEFALVRFEDKDRARIYDDFNPLKAEDVANSIYFIATQPPHVNIQDILLMGNQQAGFSLIDRSGRKFDQ